MSVVNVQRYIKYSLTLTYMYIDINIYHKTAAMHVVVVVQTPSLSLHTSHSVFVCVGVYETHPHTQTHHVTPPPPARRLQSEEAFRAEPPAQQVQFQPSGRTSVPSVVQWLNGSDSSCSEAGQALVQQSGHGGRGRGGREG